MNLDKTVRLRADEMRFRLARFCGLTGLMNQSVTITQEGARVVHDLRKTIKWVRVELSSGVWSSIRDRMCTEGSDRFMVIDRTHKLWDTLHDETMSDSMLIIDDVIVHIKLDRPYITEDWFGFRVGTIFQVLIDRINKGAKYPSDVKKNCELILEKYDSYADDSNAIVAWFGELTMGLPKDEVANEILMWKDACGDVDILELQRLTRNFNKRRAGGELNESLNFADAVAEIKEAPHPQPMAEPPRVAADWHNAPGVSLGRRKSNHHDIEVSSSSNNTIDDTVERIVDFVRSVDEHFTSGRSCSLYSPKVLGVMYSQEDHRIEIDDLWDMSILKTVDLAAAFKGIETHELQSTNDEFKEMLTNFIDGFNFGLGRDVDDRGRVRGRGRDYEDRDRDRVDSYRDFDEREARRERSRRDRRH